MPRSSLRRRTLLKSLGVSVALPWLESPNVFASEPEGAAQATGAPKRFVCLYFGDGVRAENWTFSGQGADMKLGTAFPSLERIKEKLIFIHGMHHPYTGHHAQGTAAILSDGKPTPGRVIRCGTSFDQMLARQLGQQTLLPSMSLALERPVSGYHNLSNSMAYACYLSWRSPTSPVPTEIYPSLAFDSLFQGGASRTQMSVIDHVYSQYKVLNRQVSYNDRHRLDQYAQSVREVEMDLQRLKKMSLQDGPKSSMQRPDDVLPKTLDVYAKIMLDILALAIQTDRTRIATMVMANDLSGQLYTFMGIKGDHHAMSHHHTKPSWAKVVKFYVDQYAYFIKKLDTMQEGDGTVLDNSCVVLCNEQNIAHTNEWVPWIQAGSLGGHFKTGRCLEYKRMGNGKGRKAYTHMSRIFLNISDGMGVPMQRFGEQTERLPQL